jgi:hypothetical protein
VLRLLADGHSNQAIADTLIIAVSTAKRHINNIYGKLDVQSRTQALVRARASAPLIPPTTPDPPSAERKTPRRWNRCGSRSQHTKRWAGPPSACIALVGHCYRKPGSSDLLATHLPYTCRSATPRTCYTLHFPIGMKKYTRCCTFRCVSLACRSTRVEALRV